MLCPNSCACSIDFSVEIIISPKIKGIPSSENSKSIGKESTSVSLSIFLNLEFIFLISSFVTKETDTSTLLILLFSTFKAVSIHFIIFFLRASEITKISCLSSKKTFTIFSPLNYLHILYKHL